MVKPVAAVFGALLIPSVSMGAPGAFLAEPRARQVVTNGAWKSTGEIGSFDGGGPATDTVYGHGVCGGTKNGLDLLETGVWAPTPVQAEYNAGEAIDITVHVEDHQFGHLEFRLCYPEDGGVSDAIETTQACLDKHVLKYDARVLTIGDPMRNGFAHPGDAVGDRGTLVSSEDLTEYERHSKARCDQLSSAPDGSCCGDQKKGKNTCSSEQENRERFYLPLPNTYGPKGESVYKMKYRLPDNKGCERCVLQMYYQTGMASPADPATESISHPRGIWNCADIKINGVAEEESSIVLPAIGVAFAVVMVLGAAFYAVNACGNRNQKRGPRGPQGGPSMYQGQQQYGGPGGPQGGGRGMPYGGQVQPQGPGYAGGYGGPPQQQQYQPPPTFARRVTNRFTAVLGFGNGQVPPPPPSPPPGGAAPSPRGGGAPPSFGSAPSSPAGGRGGRGRGFGQGGVGRDSLDV